MRSIWIRLILLAYPRALRRAHGEEIAQALADDLRRHRGVGARVLWLARALADAASSRRARRPNAAPPAGSRGSVLGHLSSDARSAFRMFAQSPAFAAGAVLTLSLGVGATTAIVSLADATLLHPLPVPDADRVLVSRSSWSYPDFRDFIDRQSTFSDAAGWAGIEVGLDHVGTTHAVLATAASGAYARMLRLAPRAGRLLDERDDRDGAAAVVMISDRLWARLFNRDPSAVGRTVSLNQRSAVIAGVMPAAFRGPSLTGSPDLLLPLSAIDEFGTGLFSRPETLARRTTTFLQVAGRLTDGGSPGRAEEEVNAIYRQLHATHDPASDDRIRLVTLPVRAVGLDESSDLQSFILVLAGATLVTLLLACATVANLLLVRAERRERELALRLALGAGRWRVARLLLVESVALGVAGALGGLLVARGSLSLLGAFSLPGDIRVADLGLTTNGWVLALAIGLGLATSLVFGLAPLWRASRLQLTSSLRTGQGHAVRQPLRATLVAAQVALCVMLLGGGLAFGRAVRQAFAIDLGFDTTTTAIVTMKSSVTRYPRERVMEVQSRTLEALRAAPGVRAAGWSFMRPLSGRITFDFKVPGFTPERPGDLEADVNLISPGYLEAMGLPLRAGRDIRDSDSADARPVAVVSEALARRFWPGREAIGATFATTDDPKPEDFITVVGIVGDIRRGLERDIDPIAYMPIAQRSIAFAFGEHHLIVSARGIPAAAAAREATAVIGRVDPAVPVSSVITMRDHVGAAAMVPRLGFTLFALFAALAVVLTAIGVYAVVAYAVARRTKEIGIRLALGARGAGVLRLVLAQGAWPIGAGLVLGTAAFWAASRTLTSFLLSMPAFDLTIAAAVAAGVSLIAGVALLVPTRRALSVNPAATLRGE